MTMQSPSRPPLGRLPDGVDVCIRLRGVRKAFGQSVVLDGLDLDIERAKTAVVIGPSGTGKSVLLKHIVGLLRPDRGEVWFEGQRVDQLDEADMVAVRMRMGLLFQGGALFDSMDVRENICFPLREHTKLSSREMNQRCAKVLTLVGMEGAESKMPAELSGGQRKRVALARAIVLEPDVVLYDEPTTGLDPMRADVINELIITLARHLGITSIVVTHDMASANRVADRMVMLYDGRIVADGDPRAFAQVSDDLVQRFIHGRAYPEEMEAIRAGFAKISGVSTSDES
jgi:phospholipid/cholesterol/gamma-HCH transport system ATP-binding protein